MATTAKVPVLADSRARRKPTFIDLHQDMLSGVALLDGGFPAYGESYLTGAHHASAVWSALYPTHSDDTLMVQLDAHGELLRSHSSQLRLISTVADLETEDPRTGVLPHSEGLHLPDIAPEVLDALWAEYCLRSLSLTWNHETDYGFSCFDDGAAPLKPVGRHLLGAMEHSDLFLDLAHLNEHGFFEALDCYASRVLVTHTFCRAITDHPRGLTDDQLRALGDHGGLVGLAFPPDFLGQKGSVDEALHHVDRIATLAGEDAVSIGSDWGVAEMGELGDPATLGVLVEAVDSSYGGALAEKFAYANAHEFLRTHLPIE